MAFNNLDDISKRVIKVIAESSDVELTVPEISDRIGVNGPKVHYRLEHKIEELTEKRGTEERPGSTHDATIIGLTERGKRVAADLDMTYPSTAEETIEWAQDADTRLSRASEDAEEALETAREARRVAAGVKGGLKSMFSSEIEELEERLRRRAVETVETKLGHYDLPHPTEDSIATGSDVNDVRAEVKSIRDQLNEIDERVDQDLEGQFRELNERLDEIATRQDEISIQTTQLERRLQAVENRSLRDFLPF